ncbi:hypothetical protein [Exiguobacterium alkaliphilum]|uniref:hypothetical protein n=1 Tax=Exiguobacterium alkaliphilum TaxID=1428684 RepID=UPI001BA4C524|nr:hypothetical protein [Exiguobacterium alkaliphilum]QUE87184.1 hypothetical protein KB235_04605 [Exiguobacterium alkaliphilum]
MIWERVAPLVGELVDDHTENEWRRLFEKWDGHPWHDAVPSDEKTSVLMIDANAVTTDGTPDLDALHELLKEHVQATISDLYLVSLFPYAAPPTDTRVDPRIRLAEDLSHVNHEFDLMYDVTPDVYNESQFDLLKETDLFLERLAQGATKLRVHVQSFRGMPEERIRTVLRLWHTVLHHYKPDAQLVLAYEGDAVASYFDVADAICHFDLASHTLLAFAQGDAGRLTDWAKRIGSPSEGKTYFNFLSVQERDPFEKNLIEPSADMLLAAHSILFSLQGIPSVDYRTLLGVTTPVDRDTLVQELKTDPYRLNVFSGVLGQLNVRRTHPAFSPHVPHAIKSVDKRVFTVERTSGDETVVLHTNVSDETVRVKQSGVNLFTDEPVDDIALAPYGYVWIRQN